MRFSIGLSMAFATLYKFMVTVSFKSIFPTAAGPTTNFSMYVQGMGSNKHPEAIQGNTRVVSSCHGVVRHVQQTSFGNCNDGSCPVSALRGQCSPIEGVHRNI